MPCYVYKCAVCKSTRTVTHGMNTGGYELCHCGNGMHKVPQPFRVNWNGPPPSKGGLHPTVQQFNATFDERKDAFAKRKAEHVKRTKG